MTLWCSLKCIMIKLFFSVNSMMNFCRDLIYSNKAMMEKNFFFHKERRRGSKVKTPPMHFPISLFCTLLLSLSAVSVVHDRWVSKTKLRHTWSSNKPITNNSENRTKNGASEWKNKISSRHLKGIKKVVNILIFWHGNSNTVRI